jgi:hypothetical protein
VNDILRRQPGNAFWYKNKKSTNPKFISGHIPFGVGKELGFRECSYFTFLRHPNERFKSQVHHGLTSKKSLGHALFHRHGGLKGLLEFCLKTQSSMDLMTKQLSGLENKKNAKLWSWEGTMTKKKDFGYWQIFGWSGRKTHYTEKDMNEMLKAAKDNLNKCDFVGIQENGSADHQRLIEFYELKSPKSDLHSRKSEKPSLEWDDSEVVEMLNMLNRYDLKLYEEATK